METNAVKERDKKIEELKEKLTKLETEVAELQIKMEIEICTHLINIYEKTQFYRRVYF